MTAEPVHATADLDRACADLDRDHYCIVEGLIPRFAAPVSNNA